MKKIISLLLALIIALGVIGCGNAVPQPTPIPVSTPSPTPHTEETRKSDNDIKRELSNYLDGAFLVNAVKYAISGCNSVKNISIESSSIDWDSGYETGKITYKGRCSAYDEYGNFIGVYNLDIVYKITDFGYNFTVYPDVTAKKV